MTCWWVGINTYQISVYISIINFEQMPCKNSRNVNIGYHRHLFWTKCDKNVTLGKPECQLEKILLITLKNCVCYCYTTMLFLQPHCNLLKKFQHYPNLLPSQFSVLLWFFSVIFSVIFSKWWYCIGSGALMIGCIYYL